MGYNDLHLLINKSMLRNSSYHSYIVNFLFDFSKLKYDTSR